MGTVHSVSALPCYMTSSIADTGSSSDSFTKREAAQEALYIREKELEKSVYSPSFYPWTNANHDRC